MQMIKNLKLPFIIDTLLLLSNQPKPELTKQKKAAYQNPSSTHRYIVPGGKKVFS